MDLKGLSSNWKKLQASLQPKKSDPAKPASSKQPAPASTSSAQNGLKRKRPSAPATSLVGTKTKKLRSSTEKPQKSFQRREMGAIFSSAGKTNGVEETVKVKSEGAQVTIRSSADTQRSSRGVVGGERVNEGLSLTAEIGKYVAIDCEMVGVGPNPDNDSALARVSVVNFNGEQVYDSFVRPKETVTDWRTHVSGVSPKHMATARSFEEVQRDIAKILDGRVLVGHAVQNDLDVLHLGHPKRDIRDTSKHPPYKQLAGGWQPRLKLLAEELLGLEIQGAAHSSVEDARVTMMLFRKDKEGFDREHSKRWPVRPQDEEAKPKGNGNGKKKKKSKKKKK